MGVVDERKTFADCGAVELSPHRADVIIMASVTT